MRISAGARLFKDFEAFLRTRCAPSVRAYVLATDEEALKSTSLQIVSKSPLSNGGIATHLFELML
jgi:hypothetical protein